MIPGYQAHYIAHCCLHCEGLFVYYYPSYLSILVWLGRVGVLLLLGIGISDIATITWNVVKR
jgi:hypothetical protein